MNYPHGISQSGTDGYDVIPNSEVVVKRTAHRDNTSSYTYNGKKMPFKVLAQELRRLGIDLDHNRFLILQVRKACVRMCDLSILWHALHL